MCSLCDMHARSAESQDMISIPFHALSSRGPLALCLHNAKQSSDHTDKLHMSRSNSEYAGLKICSQCGLCIAGSMKIAIPGGQQLQQRGMCLT